MLGLSETKWTIEFQGVLLFANNMLTVAPKHELSFIRSGIKTIFADIFFCDNEVKTMGKIYRRASEILGKFFAQK